MGYPDSALAAGERVVLHRHPHWKRLVAPVLALLAGSAAAAFVAALVTRAGWTPNAATVVLAVIGAVWFVAVVTLTALPVLNWRTTHFAVTDRRLMFRHGLLTRSGTDVPLARIDSVQFRHGLIDRILRTGTLIVDSAAHDRLELADIPGVEQVHALLYHEVFDTLDSAESPI